LGFSRTWSGDDHHWAFNGIHRILLLLIEFNV
jgi:hypothetical protein